jgi:DNA-directed RNA polymerase subunit RPC12/RpoP
MRETITKYKEKQEIEEEDYLECKYCGGKAIIEGT